jgi:hypothetical protein
MGCTERYQNMKYKYNEKSNLQEKGKVNAEKD